MRKTGESTPEILRPESRCVDAGLLNALFLCLSDRLPSVPAPQLRERLVPRRPSRGEWENAWIEAETLCAQSGGSAAMLPQSLLRWLDGGSFLPPLALLRELDPLLCELYQEGDPRFSLARAFASIWSRMHPFAPMSLAQAKSGAYWTELWLRIEAPETPCPADLGWLIPPLLKGFPRAFDLPAYEMARVIADPRLPRSFVDPGTVLSAGGGLELGGMRLAEPVDFATYLEEMGLPDDGAPQNHKLCMVRADYYCPRRRRVLLHAGCAYGAPWFLFKMVFRKTRPQRWNFISPIVRHLREESAVPSFSPRQASERHEPSGLRFVYHRADDSISCDGRHLTRSVPARILRRMVRDFVSQGRREFDFRLFKRDPEIIANRKRSNFEVRLRRVEEVIQGLPGMRLLHPRPGLLRLEISGTIAFDEDD